MGYQILNNFVQTFLLNQPSLDLAQNFEKKSWFVFPLTFTAISLRQGTVAKLDSPAIFGYKINNNVVHTFIVNHVWGFEGLNFYSQISHHLLSNPFGCFVFSHIFIFYYLL